MDKINKKTKIEAEEINLDENSILGKAKLLKNSTPLFHYLGKGKVNYEDGSEVELEYGIGQVTGAPMIKAANSYFELTWEDVFVIAFNHPDFSKFLIDCKTTEDESNEEKILQNINTKIDEILNKIKIKSSDVELSESFSNTEKGGEIWFDKIESMFLLRYGTVQQGDVNYLHFELFKNYPDAYKTFDSFMKGGDDND